MIYSFPEYKSNTANQLSLFLSLKWVLLFEFLFLTANSKLKSSRDKLLTTEYSKHSKKYQLVLAKRKWILDTCNKTEFEYLGFIQEIRQLQAAFTSSTRYGASWRQVLLNHIYSPDAKPRITSYIIFFMSLISLLAIRDSTGLSELLPTFFDRSYQNFIVFLFVLACVLFIIFIGFVYLVKFVVVSVDTWLAVARSDKRSSYRFVDIFIEDMASLHRLPKISVGKKC